MLLEYSIRVKHWKIVDMVFLLAAHIYDKRMKILELRMTDRFSYIFQLLDIKNFEMLSAFYKA